MYGDDEKQVLQDFVKLCDKMYQHQRQFQFGGHNIREFDIPFICRRLLINNLPLPEYLQLQDKRPWDIKIFDTLTWWKFGENDHSILLDSEVCSNAWKELTGEARTREIGRMLSGQRVTPEALKQAEQLIRLGSEER